MEGSALQLAVLESELSSFLLEHGALHRSKRADDDAPIVFIPEKGGKQCRPSHSLSSIGFLALVTSIVNAVISASNNINNNNNNRNNNNNDLNDNNNNVNVANLGSAQMNMNMVMVGRQLEKFKQERKKIWDKVRALKRLKGDKKQINRRPQKSLTTKKPEQLEEKFSEDWASDVRQELSSMLDGLPAAAAIEGGRKEEEEKTPMGTTALSFWNVLDSILPGVGRSRRSTTCHDTTNYVILGLSFIDFWLSATSPDIPDQSCLEYEICQLASDNRDSLTSPLLSKIDRLLTRGAAEYLRHLDPQTIDAEALLLAADFGRQHTNCTVFSTPICFEDE